MQLIPLGTSCQPPGSPRVADLYEVPTPRSPSCGTITSRTFFRTLDDRARKKQRRDGVSPFEAGDIKKLSDATRPSCCATMEMVIVQPGLSIAQATTQQLDLLKPHTHGLPEDHHQRTTSRVVQPSNDPP